MRDPLLARSVLVAAIAEVAGATKAEEERGNDVAPLRLEADRLTKRLAAVQREIEKHDLD
jgi:hypothetical protein